MCTYSTVMDFFKPKFEFIEQKWDPTGFNPLVTSELEQFRKLIEQFKEAIEAAKKLDILLNQPDCEDPEKAKLEKRVAFLEKKLKAITKVKAAIKKKKKSL